MKKRAVKARMTLLILLTFCLYFVAGTYARYTSTASGTAEVQVAKWAVTVNDEDMTTNNAEFDIAFTVKDNENVVDGKIAPATTLYADLVIDPKGSEVAIDYSFELGAISAEPATTLPDSLKVSKVVLVEDDVEGTELTATNGKYTGTIELADQSSALTSEEAVTVRVYVAWDNDEANNAADTTLGKNAPKLTIPVTAVASQHIG